MQSLIISFRNYSKAGFYLTNVIVFQDGTNPDVKNKAMSYNGITYLQV